MPSSAFMCANFSDLKLFCIAIPCANLTDVHGVVHYERNISCKKKIVLLTSQRIPLYLKLSALI